MAIVPAPSDSVMIFYDENRGATTYNKKSIDLPPSPPHGNNSIIIGGNRINMTR